tara:strand:- start:875 stop:1684 length:810 start_codon:yes stop_codon:yes gene_type:complete
MKKALIIFIILFFSCSESDDVSEDSSNETENVLLIKEITFQDRELPNTYSYNDEYFYDGTKIERYVRKYYYNNELSGSVTYNFVYTNNLIVSIASNDLMYGTYNFSYDTSGRLAQSTYCDDYTSCGNPDRTVYSYSNSNKTITMNDYTAGNLDYTIVAQLDSNDNVISIEETDLEDNSIYTRTFKYDNYKSPFLNITGALALISPASYLTSSDLVSMRNNCILDQDSDNYNLNISYDYNEDGYPRQAIINEEGYGSSNMTLRYVSVNNN